MKRGGENNINKEERKSKEKNERNERRKLNERGKAWKEGNMMMTVPKSILGLAYISCKKGIKRNGSLA